MLREAADVFEHGPALYYLALASRSGDEVLGVDVDADRFADLAPRGVGRAGGRDRLTFLS